MKCINLLGFLTLLLLGCKGEAIIFDAPDPIHISEELTIDEGDSLIINAGTVITIDTGVSIIARGNVFINGTEENPVIIKASDPKYGWGILRAKGECAQLTIHNAIIEDGQIMSYQTDNHFKNVQFKTQQQLAWNDAIARFWYGKVLIENCSIDGINRGEGFLLHNVQEPIIRNCSFRKIPDAIEYIDCGNGQIIGNHFQSMNDDAIDQNSCWNTLIKDNRIFDVKDCGMELGSEKFGSSRDLRVENNLIVGCKKGIIVKESSHAIIRNNTFFNNQIGIEVHTDADSTKVSQIEVTRCVIAGETNPILANARSAASLLQCLSNHDLPKGEKNLIAPVDFKNTKVANYTITSGDLPEGTEIETIGYQHKK